MSEFVDGQDEGANENGYEQLMEMPDFVARAVEAPDEAAQKAEQERREDNRRRCREAYAKIKKLADEAGVDIIEYIEDRFGEDSEEGSDADALAKKRGEMIDALVHSLTERSDEENGRSHIVDVAGICDFIIEEGTISRYDGIDLSKSGMFGDLGGKELDLTHAGAVSMVAEHLGLRKPEDLESISKSIADMDITADTYEKINKNAICAEQIAEGNASVKNARISNIVSIFYSYPEELQRAISSSGEGGFVSQIAEKLDSDSSIADTAHTEVFQEMARAAGASEEQLDKFCAASFIEYAYSHSFRGGDDERAKYILSRLSSITIDDNLIEQYLSKSDPAFRETPKTAAETLRFCLAEIIEAQLDESNPENVEAARECIALNPDVMDEAIWHQRGKVIKTGAQVALDRSPKLRAFPEILQFAESKDIAYIIQRYYGGEQDADKVNPVMARRQMMQELTEMKTGGFGEEVPEELVEILNSDKYIKDSIASAGKLVHTEAIFKMYPELESFKSLLDKGCPLNFAMTDILSKMQGEDGLSGDSLRDYMRNAINDHGKPEDIFRIAAEDEFIRKFVVDCPSIIKAASKQDLAIFIPNADELQHEIDCMVRPEEKEIAVKAASKLGEGITAQETRDAIMYEMMSREDGEGARYALRQGVDALARFKEYDPDLYDKFVGSIENAAIGGVTGHTSAAALKKYFEGVPLEVLDYVIEDKNAVRVVYKACSIPGLHNAAIYLARVVEDPQNTDIDLIFDGDTINISEAIKQKQVSLLTLLELKQEQLDQLTDYPKKQALEEYLSMSYKVRIIFDRFVYDRRKVGIDKLLADDDEEFASISDLLTPRENAMYQYLTTDPNAKLFIDESPYGLLQYFDENGPKMSLEYRRIGKGAEIDQQSFESINEDNILLALSRFIYMDSIDWEKAGGGDRSIRDAFMDTKTKNLAMAKLREQYEKYLKNPSAFPDGLAALSLVSAECDGCGPLTQIESLLGFTGEFLKLDDGSETRGRLQSIEKRFKKDRWDDADRSAFYDISAEMLRASPDIFGEFSEIISSSEISSKDFEAFIKEIFPLYRAKLVLLRGNYATGDGVGHGTTVADYSSVDVNELKNQLHNILLPYNLQESQERRTEALQIMREKIFEEISTLFQSKFGILEQAIPGEFSPEDARAVEDFSIYLSNLHDPNAKKEHILGLFLALQLSEKQKAWNALRSGQSIDAADFMNPSIAAELNELIAKSREASPITAENTGIQDPDRLAEFTASAQSETSEIRTGSIETVDRKLQTLIGDIGELQDPDLYGSPLDKRRIEILDKYRDKMKMVRATASKLWQQARSRESGKDGSSIVLSPEEQEIAEDLLSMLNENGVEITTDSIKEELQSGFEPLRVAFGMQDKVEKREAVQRIGELQSMLIPPQEIASIFARLDVAFTQNSGIMAISPDIGYLQDLAEKNSDALTEEESAKVSQYLETIREKLDEIQECYDALLQDFETMKRSVGADEENRALMEKLHEMEVMLHRGDHEQVIVSVCTTDMRTILENMRACLSAMTKGVNNDTDLTFGEPYKFYLYSRDGGSRKSSISDQIVHLVPVSEENGEDKHLSFVMDRVYGLKTMDVLVSHVVVMVKKAAELKRQFPESSISVTVSSNAISSCSATLNKATILTELAAAGIEISEDQIIQTSPTVTEPESPYGDHYIEYGGMARTAGDRKIDGTNYEIRF